MKILGKRILIEPATTDRTKSGIYLPPRTAPDGQDQEGTVAAIGSAIKENLPYRKGSHVFVEMYKGGFSTALEYNGKEYRLVAQDVIVGTLGPDGGFRPVGNKILVEPDKKVAGNIIRPSAYEADPDELIACTVRLVGNGIKRKDGKYHPFQVGIMDRIIIKACAGRDVDLAETTYKLITEQDIEGVIIE